MIKNLQDSDLLINLTMNRLIYNTIKKFNMISAGDTVLLAVSGGADSMLMLDYFYNHKESFNISIKVAHVEHGIRGQDSLDDADFVKDYCYKRGIEFHILSIDAVAEAKKAGMSVEEYSRMRRYEFFESVECDKIATAHNLTDNVETVIFRMARGTGIKGVCGIPAVRGKIIRPLIEVTSESIREYCICNDISYRTDSTNADNTYTRNKIRNDILPLLKKINSDYENQFLSFINDINEDNSFIEAAADELYQSVLYKDKLSVEKMNSLHVSIQKRIIKKYFCEHGYTLDRLHLCQVLKLLFRQGKIQISDNIFALSDKKYLRIADLKHRKNNFEFVSQILNINEFNSKNIDFYCDCDKIIGSIAVRSRAEGDTISPAGRGCTKSLKKLFNELHIPVEQRSSTAVICDSAGVIGVAGFCCDERVKTDSHTKNVIAIKFLLED